MPREPEIKAMPRSKRRFVFLIFLLIFMAMIPFLYLYATGYRLDFGGEINRFVSTGGIFVSADQENVEIYIDDELVRETRRFRKAFYAQNIDAGTHRVSVQKDGYHTWVKELPVYSHLVTEVQAFNFPIEPYARIVTRFETATGTPVFLGGTHAKASTTQVIYATSTLATTTLVRSATFKDYLRLFDLEKVTTAKPTASRVVTRIEETATELLRGSSATSTPAVATTTKEYNGVRLFERDGDVYAMWVGSRDNMPYYYCAEAFPRLEASSTASVLEKGSGSLEALAIRGPGNNTAKALLEGPQVQQVPEDVACVPEIRIDRKWQKVSHFDFFPGSTDLVMMVLEEGVYVVEIDDRSWQNTQPILLGRNLSARVDNGRVIVYDKTNFYEMIFEIPE